jgi:hypothetical protein
MKAINKAWTKGIEALKALGLTDIDIEKLKHGIPSYEKKPFASWALSNNNAEIRRVKAKIEELDKLNQTEDASTAFKGGELRINTDINRVQFIFDDKPCEAVRTLLKSKGFRWAPSEGAWQRQRTLDAVRASKYLIPKIEETLE